MKMTNNPNRSSREFSYRVTGDFMRMVYSRHTSLEAAKKAARALSSRWGVSHAGSEPAVEEMTPSGWNVVSSYNFGAEV
jgi:hypothetical protein